MSAFRFYRREAVPEVKEEHPDLDGKARHKIVRQRWRSLDEQSRLVYVMMSRADRERAIYMNKLAQIKDSLLREHPELFLSQIPDSILTKTSQSKEMPPVYAFDALNKISAQLDAEKQAISKSQNEFLSEESGESFS